MTDEGDWRERLQTESKKDGSKVYQKSLTNAIDIFTLDEGWLIQNGGPAHHVLGYNEFSDTIEFRHPPPWHEHTKSLAPEAGTWTDDDNVRAADWLSRKYFKLTTKTVEEAIRLVAKKNAYHPVRDYLNSLTWDEERRLGKWLRRYLGASADPYVEKIGLWWMISAVARIFEPGCQVDYTLILEGAQGTFKSSALRVLGGEWFCDSRLDLNSKDSFVNLRGTWIYELSELETLRRAEADQAKAYLTSPSDHYRAPYERYARKFKRQNVFAGTVNGDFYLKDPTGGRRYLPCKCGRIDLVGLRADRDQLWAEAQFLYHLGTKWHPELDEEREWCLREQEKRFEMDEWENRIAGWLGEKTEVSLSDVLSKALLIEVGRWTRSDQMRANACLKRLGWSRRQVMREGMRLWVWVCERPKKVGYDEMPY